MPRGHPISAWATTASPESVPLPARGRSAPRRSPNPNCDFADDSCCKVVNGRAPGPLRAVPALTSDIPVDDQRGQHVQGTEVGSSQRSRGTLRHQQAPHCEGGPVCSGFKTQAQHSLGNTGAAPGHHQLPVRPGAQPGRLTDAEYINTPGRRHTRRRKAATLSVERNLRRRSRSSPCRAYIRHRMGGVGACQHDRHRFRTTTLPRTQPETQPPRVVRANWLQPVLLDAGEDHPPTDHHRGARAPSRTVEDVDRSPEAAGHRGRIHRNPRGRPPMPGPVSLARRAGTTTTHRGPSSDQLGRDRLCPRRIAPPSPPRSPTHKDAAQFGASRPSVTTELSPDACRDTARPPSARHPSSAPRQGLSLCVHRHQ